MLGSMHAALKAASADAEHQILMRNDSWLEAAYQCTNEGESLPQDLASCPSGCMLLSLACSACLS